MELFKKKHIFLILICFGLLLLIFNWITYLTNNNYIVECFDTNNTVTVDLPLTTTYSCQNFCGPTSRCSISGQQCFTDIDCPGCQPNTPSSRQNNITNNTTNIPGDNDAGKLTVGVTPQYSTLTSGYGTHQKVITNDMFSKPSYPSFGINTWISEFNTQQKWFNDKFKPDKLEYMPNYPERYSLTGEFINDGPLPSNSPSPSM